jgi:hypothetical protein
LEQWDKNFYITSIAGANNGSSVVVMSKGLIANNVTFCNGELAFLFFLVNIGCYPTSWRSSSGFVILLGTNSF